VDGQSLLLQRLQPNFCKIIPYSFSETCAEAIRNFNFYSLAEAESFSKFSAIHVFYSVISVYFEIFNFPTLTFLSGILSSGSKVNEIGSPSRGI
jgi:hypothetical protein